MSRPAATSLLAALAACLLSLGGCGGGGGSSGASGSGNPPAVPNVVDVVVDQGPVDTASSSRLPIGSVDTPFVTITLCAHGTDTCQTIDHISVDTGSSGLRVIASALSGPLAAALGQVTDAQGRALAECLPFADGYSWGSVKQADARIGGEQASGISIQVIGDAALPTVPDACSSGGATQEDTVTAFGGNGILGISTFRQDCGALCVTSTFPGVYFGCPTSSTCTPTTVALANQVWNPVALFAADNNGAILALDRVDDAGAGSASGSLIFGIDTRSNNALGTATVLAVDPASGNLSVTFNSQRLANSFIDSGSNGYFFDDSSIAGCTRPTEKGFYCPASTQQLSATITSNTGVVALVSFSVANADSLFSKGSGSFSAFDDLGGTNPDSGSFDFGLPFFMGRRVYAAIEQSTTSAGAGPFVAY